MLENYEYWVSYIFNLIVFTVFMDLHKPMSST